MTTRCGFIAVVGAPNAGKSTLVNHLVGARIAIVTPKVQTTRHRILGMMVHEQSQLIFIDTPGVFNASARFEKAMVKSALGSTKEADIILLLVDAHKGLCANTQRVIDSISGLETPVILILNKIDKVSKESLLGLTQSLYAQRQFDECFMISALKGQGTEDLTSWLAGALPEDVWHYPEEQMTDLPMRQLAAEITRESLFFRLKQELPYSIAVDTESWEDTSHNAVKIQQVIYVQNESQKKIVVGHKGEMLREIGKAARGRIGRFLQRKVHLFLFVKISPKWKDNKEFYSAIGLEY
ncbi:MAG: GTPase Era [Sphaerospermopsis sp. SIO1G2]|nr:GTPase Era [Sphaerospermopsis sp. SIO1G2]